MFGWVEDTYVFDGTTYSALGVEVIAIPEPGQIAALFGLAVLVLVWRRR